VHLVGQRAGEGVQCTRAGVLGGRVGAHRGGPRGCLGSRVAIGVEREDGVEVRRGVLSGDGVDLGSCRTESGTPKQARGGLPPRRLTSHGPPTHSLPVGALADRTDSGPILGLAV